MPRMPSVVFSRRAKIAVSVVAIVIVLLIVLVKLSGVYINFLWYDELHAHQVYSTMLWTRVSLFFIFGALMALIIGGNIVLAYVLRPPFRPMSPEQQNLQNYVLMIEPRRKWILAGVVFLTFLSAGLSAKDEWATWQLWLHGGSFGITDQQFHRDISFYAWDYPVYRSLLGFGFVAVLVSIILSVGIHYLTGAIRLQTPGPKVTLAARRHLTALVFVFMLLKAMAYWLDRYGFVFSTRSKFTGASYTDVHSALPAKTILFWLAIVLALGVLASIWLRSVLLPGIGFAVLLILAILINGIYPFAVQQISVKPSASDKEAPYIERNINATRQAYGIVTANSSGTNGGTVTYQDYAATTSPDPSAVTSTNTTVSNIRILDPNVVSSTFLNAQKIGRPYGFSPTLNIDRYTIGGVTHDYVVAVREQATGSNLTGSQDNWINQHTVYTHGYGFVAAQADKDVTNGKPSDYTEGDIPPAGPLNIGQPDVYYGQLMNDYSIVGARGTPREFNANGGANVTYHGKGGVSLGSFLTRLAFAFKYKQTNFVLNDAVNAPGAKIIFVRDPKERVQKIAPFLTVDGSPYPFVDQQTGHMMWMVDGYTTMANYPYSQRQSLSTLTHTSLQSGQQDRQINYIRNSVKATVDAYDGTVTLYAWEPNDPVLKTWMHVFPGLLKPKSDMPQAVLDHIRYPQDLFDVQRGLLAQYHISDPVAWYNGRGAWAVPSDPFAAAALNQPAYYVLANSPDSTSNVPVFQLTTPMVVNGANNLAAYASVDSDPGPNYGKITVLQTPTNATIQGPSQIAAVFKQNARISSDITLLGTGQSSVIHGNLLTLPLGDSFLYVEPLYVQAIGTGSYPTLQRVLVTYGDHIGYGATLSDALDDISLGRSPGASIQTSQTTGNGSGKTTTPPPPPTTPETPTSGSTSTPAPLPSTVNGVLAKLDDINAKIDAAKSSSPPDLVEIARLQEREQQLVQQLLRLNPPPSPSPGSS
jgi:uncharacterized membrane protein (UPF0182 family)